MHNKNLPKPHFLVVPVMQSDEQATAPRYYCPLFEKDLTNRSHTSTLHKTHERIRTNATVYFGEETECHVWQLNDNGEPSLFLSGLLAVREGRMRRSEMEALHEQLLPHILNEQLMIPNRFLVVGDLKASSWIEEPDGEFADFEQERLIDAADLTFDHVEHRDSYCGDEEAFAEMTVYQSVTVNLPYIVTEQSSSIHLKYAEAIARIDFENLVHWEMDGDLDEIDVLLLDADQVPTTYLTGLLKQLNGVVTREEVTAMTETLRQHWSVRLHGAYAA